MAKHYKIEGKKIYANLEAATDEEFKVIERYSKLGYEIITAGEEKAKKPRKNGLKEEDILAYLKANDEAAIATYEAKKAEPATDEQGNIKKRKTGTIIRKGFNFARQWFETSYPVKIDEELGADKAAAEAEYKKYTKNNGDGATLSAAEFKRRYYWKNLK